MVTFERHEKILCIFTITLRCIIYTILLAAFMTFFLKDQMVAYISGRTTITSKVEEASTLEFPTMTLCMQPGTKMSVRQKYNLTSPNSALFQDIQNLTILEAMQKQSYLMNQDFQLKINQSKMKIGTNNDTHVEPVVTSLFGTCYKISLAFEIMPSMTPFVLDLQVILNSTLSEKPQKMLVYLTSNNTWHGVANTWWPQYKPSVIALDFKSNAGFEDLSHVSIKPIEHHFREGHSDMVKCATNVLEQSCDNLCKVVSTIDAPFCNNTEEYQCTWKAWKLNEKPYIDCFKTKKALTFDMKEEIVQVMNTEKVEQTKASLRLKLQSMTKEIREETEIVTTPDLIGSVGGSLGMFFGFTIAPNIDIIIEKGKTWVLNRHQIQRRSGT